MNYIAFVLSLFLVAGCAHTSTTSETVDIVGLWKGEYRTPMGGPPMRLAFNFIRDGESIGGVTRNESIQGEWDRLEDFKIKGNNISFTSSPKTSQGKITFKYRGKIEGDTIKLAYKIKGAGKPVGGSGGFDAAGKVGRGGMYDISKGLDTGSEYSNEFTLIRVQ